jgi:hypothetical protein
VASTKGKKTKKTLLEKEQTKEMMEKNSNLFCMVSKK